MKRPLNDEELKKNWGRFYAEADYQKYPFTTIYKVGPNENYRPQMNDVFIDNGEPCYVETFGIDDIQTGDLVEIQDKRFDKGCILDRVAIRIEDEVFLVHHLPYSHKLNCDSLVVECDSIMYFPPVYKIVRVSRKTKATSNNLEVLYEL